MAAIAEKKPLDDLRWLGDDLDAINELLERKIPQTIQRFAQDEAGSRG